MKQQDINLRHLIQLVAVCDNNFSVSRAACKLNIAQSVVSRNLQSLEQSFGGPLFIRRGRRLTGMTPLCEALLESVRDINMRLDDLHQIAVAARNLPARGEIRIACTHLQARYILPKVLKVIRQQHPRIKVTINQVFPVQINEMLVNYQADLGICSEELPDEALMHSVEAYSWERAAIMCPDHKLARPSAITLKQLAEQPTITYVHGITGRSKFDSVFAEHGLFPNVIIAAADSDVIKQFTREGHGVGVISSIAYDSIHDKDLVMRRLPKQFGAMRARLIYRRNHRFNDAKRLFIDAFCSVSKELTHSSANLFS